MADKSTDTVKWQVQILKLANSYTHKELRITCAIPQEAGAKFIQSMGWPTEEKPIWAMMELMLKQDGAPVVKAPEPNVHNAYSRRAGMLSADRLFWRYIEAPGEDPATFAASYIRNQCGVASRRDILPGTDAAATFDSLELAFKLWANKPKYVEGIEGKVRHGPLDREGRFDVNT